MAKSINPLTQWTCDKCGGLVSLDDGYVVWADRDQQDNSFRIIHKAACDDSNRYMSSLPLADFIGPDGLSKLMTFLSFGPLAETPGEEVIASRVNDVNLFVDFLRRVQTPYYEEARRWFSDPDERERMADWNEFAPYSQENLRRLAEK
jgi:hypothetical protein